ncbi:MAG: hypothetical protein HY059_03240 [Proteobacteria bacterium]|nr:hypothetical protein [Pseudomonadota bacterium]
MRNVAALLLMLPFFLGGCDTSQMPKGVGGVIIGGAAEWKTVPPGEANFSVVGDWSLITGPWSNRYIATRYQTSVRIDGGSMIYESDVNTSKDDPAKKNLQIVYENDLKIEQSLGTTLESGNPKTVYAQQTRIDYAIWRGRGRACMGFFIFYQPSLQNYRGGDYYSGYARGTRCVNSPGAAADGLEEATLDLAKRVVFDRGNANKLRQPVAQSSAPPQAAAAPVRAASVAAYATSLQIGNFLRMKSGGYRVTAKSDQAVTMANPSGATGRWIGGFFIPPRGTGDTYAQDVLGLVPVAVGKSAEFVETGNGTDSWLHTISVVREEQVRVGDETYRTFVIEMREKAGAPSQGSYERLRTAWFAPQLGFPLRYKRQNIAGTNASEIEWEVLEIQPPK